MTRYFSNFNSDAGWPYLLDSFGSVASMGTGVTQ
jgi:hypothetical protein